MSVPTGTVTFLFTDIEGSTRRWEQSPRQMGIALQRHDALLREAIEANGGYVFKTVGDAFCAAFASPQNALVAALAAQRALQAEDWDTLFRVPHSALRIRMALHTGVAEHRDGDYFGQPLNRVARLLSAGHGGQTLLSLSACELVRDNLPVGASLHDMGEHRLKDLFRPERIFQLVAPDLLSQFPPLNTLDNRPNNLPAQTTPLVGREKEVADLVERLRRPQVRLVTLTGVGGTGKTRLGLQVAADLLDDFEKGVFFVSLASIRDPGLVASTIALALGVQEAAGKPLIESLKDYLREKQLLLVLDNFEQVVSSAPLVSELLAAAPRLKVMVTSREVLHLTGEHEYPVSPLEVPDHKHLPPLERLTQYEGVRLFIERAVAARPDFAVTNENAPAVAEICVRLDGLPLAIELAAARIKLLPPQAMLSRLVEPHSNASLRLKLLTGGARDLPARQQTLRATIEWSYELLSEGEKQLFRRMAPFSGGRTLEALEAVCDYDGHLRIEVLEGVESLVSKSLLQQREGRDGEARLWMLETIHEYAREKLEESGEGGELYKEHALYFMRLVEDAEPHLIGAKQIEWLHRLEEEHDNLRAALQWAKERGKQGEQGDAEAREGVEIGLRIAGALWRFWVVRGYFSEGREQMAGMLAVPILPTVPTVPTATTVSTGQAPAFPPSQTSQTRSQSPHSLPLYRAKALNGAGRLAYRQGDYTGARSLHEESLTISRELGDKGGIALSLNNLGNVANDQGDYAGARSLHEESLAIKRELGDKGGIATSLNSLGIVANIQGDYAGARSLYEESLAIKRELGDKMGIALSLNNLGCMANVQGDYAGARSLHEESLAISRGLGDKWGIALSLNNLGNVAYMQGDYTGARSLYEESLAISRELGAKEGIAVSLTGLGGVAVGRGQGQGEEQTHGQTQKQGQAERGARLLGAAEGLLEAIGAVMDPEDRMVYEQGTASARAQLSEEEFERAWAEGRAMSMERAIAFALEES